jgi:hypothetical protein
MSLSLSIPDDELVSRETNRDRAGWAATVAAAWHEARGAALLMIVSVGAKLVQAKAALPHGDFLAMIEADLPFGARTAERLMAVAQDARLANPTHASLLPPSWMTLYELSRLDDAAFARAVAAGRIKPDMEREDAVKLRGGATFDETHVDDENRDEHDFNKTAAETVERLCAVEKFIGRIAEPACGDGAIARVLIEQGYDVASYDLIDRGYGTGGVDFLATDVLDGDNVVTNPPYKIWREFVEHAVELVDERGKVAMFAPIRYLAGIDRRAIFERTQLSRAWIFADRQKTLRNNWVDTGNGSKVDTMWLVWDPAHVGDPTFGWL